MGGGLIELVDEAERLAIRLRHIASTIKREVYKEIKWDGRTIGDEWLIMYYATNLEWEAEAMANVIGNYSQNLRRIINKRKGEDGKA